MLCFDSLIHHNRIEKPPKPHYALCLLFHGSHVCWLLLVVKCKVMRRSWTKHNAMFEEDWYIVLFYLYDGFHYKVRILAKVSGLVKNCFRCSTKENSRLWLLIKRWTDTEKKYIYVGLVNWCPTIPSLISPSPYLLLGNSISFRSRTHQSIYILHHPLSFRSTFGIFQNNTSI